MLSTFVLYPEKMQANIFKKYLSHDHNLEKKLEDKTSTPENGFFLMCQLV